MGWKGKNLKEPSVVAMMWNAAMELRMDSTTRYCLVCCRAGGCAGDKAIGCCNGFIIGFIDAGDFVVVVLTLWQCRSIYRRSRKSPRFPYMMNILFRCESERERCRLERLLVCCLLLCSCFFVVFRGSPFSLREKRMKKLVEVLKGLLSPCR
jgi:hypothetical protein